MQRKHFCIYYNLSEMANSLSVNRIKTLEQELEHFQGSATRNRR